MLNTSYCLLSGCGCQSQETLNIKGRAKDLIISKSKLFTEYNVYSSVENKSTTIQNTVISKVDQSTLARGTLLSKLH